MIRDGLTVKQLLEELKEADPDALVAVPAPGLDGSEQPATKVEQGLLGGFAGRYSYEKVLVLRIS